MIFGVVTAEIAKEFVESLRCHDRGKIFEDVVQRSGVTLYMSDDKKDIRLQGFWDSVKDAHDLLEGEYGGMVSYPSSAKDGCGRQLSRQNRMAVLATKPWPSQGPRVPDNTRVQPRGNLDGASKSPWKTMRKWPKAPDPVIIFEGVGPGMPSTADLLSRGNKEEIKKAIEVVTRSSAVPSSITVQQFPEAQSDAKITDANDSSVNLPEKPVDADEAIPPSQADDDDDYHDDGNADDNEATEGEQVIECKNEDLTVPKTEKSPKSAAKETTEDTEEADVGPEQRPVRTKSGPQTRGNKRKAGRPRKIPIKTASSDEGAQEDSDSDYSTQPKKSNRRKRLPVRKSLRRRVPTRRQPAAPSPDEPVVKRKRGRPRKTEVRAETFKCKECDFIGKNKGQLKNHKRRMHGTEAGSCRCPVCDKQFSFEKDMKRHMMRHVDTRYPCDICGRVYKDRKTMLTHKERHNESYVPPSFSCDQCSKSFCTKYILANHVKSEHLGLKRMFLCPTCGKSFTQKHAYLQHANVHLGIKPFVCEVCNKAFAYEKSLKEHKFMHQEAKNFVCEICSKAFRQKSALVVHAKIHKPTKDFLCSVCSKGFTQKQALLRHERVHNGEKPFACGICGRSFSDKSIIRRHMILVHKRDSKQWKENTFEEQKKRSDYFVTPKLNSDMDEDIIVTTSADNSLSTARPLQAMSHQPPSIPPSVSVEQRESNHATPDPLPMSPVPIPPRLPSVPISMVPPAPVPSISSHGEENLHPAHSGMPAISHGGALFNPRDMHEMRDIRDIRDMRDIQDMRDLRAPEIRPVELRDMRTGEIRELQAAEIRDMRTPDVRDLRVAGLREHAKVTSLTDLRDIRVPDMRDMRLADMRDIRSGHNELRDLRDMRDSHLAGPPLPSPVHDSAPVTSHSVADLSPGSMTSSSNYPSSVPPGISTHHGAYPSTVTSPSAMPVHHYPYMYSNIPQNYDPHSGAPYIQQPQMNYYQ
ncbi:GDNF-inducible zinc finger protein 1-like [Liolophura sinensis]|uniref:GDNF-inducible zinc finger protein 1-like n=1 Tax=Liolophura sinensis TaxID=3198878 RepID=UPI0031581360